ncbi:MAG TPA: extracellular solute-binding protein [Nocardioidaceae bacterium]|nr:extracellular solute-binding protein [Nocardioidaceae bacterium]
MTRRHRLLTALAVLGALTAAGCSSAVGDDDNVVRVYSARHYDLEPAFERFHDETGIDVEFLYGTDAELRERIRAEGENTLADVYMTVDAGNLALAAEDGMFQPLRSPLLERTIPDSLQHPQGLWYGLSIRTRPIVYNPGAVDPARLSTYEDLADPRWQGRLCLRRSTNVYTQSLVASLIAHHGRQEALRIVSGWADNADILNNDVEILENIESGSCDVGISNHYYLARILEEDPDFGVEIFWPNQDGRGVHVNTSGAGVTRNADDPELAKRLIEWLATDGQQPFVAANHEYPANPDVQPDPVIRRFGEFEGDRLEASRFGALNAEAIELMAEAGYE